ncbi:MAG TPA: holo-ACP synthase [Ignavibacteriaceae bacterium]|nr:holo-ACP synthase [Ignavibacteriaceae bacterium]
MILGIGIDIIEIDRVKESIDRFGDHFLNKIYTPNELEYCLSKHNKYQHFAARFAAKEAIYKALSSEWGSDISWQDMDIMNEPNGLPVVKFSGNLKEFVNKDKSIKISMSHSDNYVACVAIVFKVK